MIDSKLVGSWWVYKDSNNRLFTYKGLTEPSQITQDWCSLSTDAEFGWLDLCDINDHCRNRTPGGKTIITVFEFCKIVDISLLNVNPGCAIQIEIFPSGNWVMYD